MSDLVTVTFDRHDRFPGMHEYGPDIDVRLDQLVDEGRSPVKFGDVDRWWTESLPAYVERHETGPIILFAAEDLSAVAALVGEVRELAREWAVRSTGDWPIYRAVSVRYGPQAGEDDRYDEYYVSTGVKVTTDAIIAADRLDEMIAFVFQIGAPS